MSGLSASWTESRWRALEEGIGWICRAQDAGHEPAVRSVDASGAWSQPMIAASGQAAALLAAAAVEHATRAQRIAEWTVGALGTEPSLPKRLRAASGVIDAAIAAGNYSLQRLIRAALKSDQFAAASDPADVAMLSVLKVEADSPGSATSEVEQALPPLAERIATPSNPLPRAVGPEPVTADRLVEVATTLWRSTRAVPSSASSAAATRIGAWLVDRFEVRGILDRQYPRSGQAGEWAAVETVCRAARLWLDIYKATGDGWYLNPALHLIDVISASQHHPLLTSNLTGSVPAALPATGSRAVDGDAGATVAFLLAIVAEQEALFMHALGGARLQAVSPAG